MRSAIVVLCVLLASGCYRTHYENFSPNNPNRTPQAPHRVRTTGWQHFFVWGLAPDERVIDARTACGGTENLASIQTRQTFVEGLVAALAGYYVNIYSPWDGAVYCGTFPGSPPQPPTTP